MRRCSSWVFLSMLAVILFGWYSLPREKLIPFSADPKRATWLLGGDEPVYLLTAQAIASGDGQNIYGVIRRMTHTNFQSNIVCGEGGNTWAQYRRKNVPCWFDRGQAWGDRETLHRPPLISLILAPIAFRSDHVRWSACLIISLFTIFGAVLTLGLQPRENIARAFFATLFVLGSIPMAYYTCQIYPETVVGIFLLTALVLNTRESRPLQWAGYALMIATLWGTPRVFLGVMGAACVYSFRSVIRRDFIGLAIIAVGLALYFAHNLWLWGFPLPPNPDPYSPFSPANIPKGILINFWSGPVGLFFLSPVAFVGFVCLWWALASHPRDYSSWAIFMLLAGTAITVSAFPNFRAGTCPAGRYQVIQGYLLLFPILECLRLSAAPWRGRVIYALWFLGPLSLVIAFFVLRWPSCWCQHYHPVFKYAWLDPFYPFLPNPESRWFVGEALLWCVPFCCVLFIRDAIQWCHARLDRRSRSGAG